MNQPTHLICDLKVNSGSTFQDINLVMGLLCDLAQFGSMSRAWRKQNTVYNTVLKHTLTLQ
jgi:hypothetical protein